MCFDLDVDGTALENQVGANPGSDIPETTRGIYIPSFDEAEDVYRKALEINRAEGRQEGMAEDYNNLGNVYQERGRLDEAEQMYRRALAIFENLGDFVTIEQVRIWITDLEAHRRLQ